jgi:hypothetical protein
MRLALFSDLTASNEEPCLFLEVASIHFSFVMTEHGTPCFALVRHDDTGIELSYLHFITQRPPSRKQEVSSPFRCDSLSKADDAPAICAAVPRGVARGRMGGKAPSDRTGFWTS